MKLEVGDENEVQMKKSLRDSLSPLPVPIHNIDVVHGKVIHGRIDSRTRNKGPCFR